MILEGITLEEAEEIMGNYTGPSSSVLYTADFVKSKSDKIAKSYIDGDLHKLYAEINDALITASDEGEYSVTIQKNTLDKYKLVVIRGAIDGLKEAGYKVEASIIYPTVPGVPIINKILIKWD
jgi:hypothetical protein